MSRSRFLSMVLLLVGCSILIAQDEEKLKSGPKVGTFMPAPFECFNVNGPAKGRPHCLVCQFALSPTVLIFAKEPADGKDEAFTDLLKKLDDTAAEFADRSFSVGVVILSPDGRDSTNNTAEEKTEELVKEAVDREKLLERLDKRAKDLKHVVIAYHLPPGPNKYDINPKAELTILFYERLKIMEKYVFAPDQLDGKDVDRIVKRVRDELPLRKKVVERKG